MKITKTLLTAAVLVTLGSSVMAANYKSSFRGFK